MRGFLLALLLAAPLRAAGPKIEFSEREHDFGTFAEGSEVRHDFVFRNAGDAPLRILSVKTSCGCTAAAASPKPVKPGKTGKIDVSYDSRGRAGLFHKEVRVTSDDPSSPTVDLQIHGQAMPAGAAVPPAPGCAAELPCSDDLEQEK